ncbi:protein phosphatase methylesterase [Pholiota conissans]|uniref:Protein phosphatase methylesterase 1 n=1 Tax=Pholiota conissans TaxID=109636 RepID=A0A9P6D4N0_9AGAR|nr:protein phosphatase methylesterase [Pholiota conissans]
MSNLYRSAISARAAKLPVVLPTPSPSMDTAGVNEEDEDAEGEDSVGSLPGPGLGPPALPASRSSLLKRTPKVPNPKYAPISASGFFTEALQVAISSRDLDCRVYYTPPKFKDGTVMVCHHGAGYSGVSFACFAKEVTELSKGECGIISIDARRHGRTTSTDGNDGDLSVDVLVEDFCAIISSIYSDPASAPSLILVGHSMGGSVVTRSCPILQKSSYKIGGVAVLDVVEGSAVDALPHMNNLLNARPDGFDSMEEAIEWHVNTNTIQNPLSARVSIPSSIKHVEGALPPYQWRTPLRSTAPYWLSWFQGLSSSFLATRTARLLVLAGTDRLDKELMIGQMQGKFQMVVVPGVGHMLHEDDPTRLAEILVEFWKRNERVMVGIKKVGDL